MDKLFTASYLFDDKSGESVEWSLDFYAKDWGEAIEKLKAIKETLKLDGEVHETIKISED